MSRLLLGRACAYDHTLQRFPWPTAMHVLADVTRKRQQLL